MSTPRSPKQDAISDRAMALWGAWYRDTCATGALPNLRTMQDQMTHAYDLAEAEWLAGALSVSS